MGGCGLLLGCPLSLQTAAKFMDGYMYNAYIQVFTGMKNLCKSFVK